MVCMHTHSSTTHCKIVSHITLQHHSWVPRKYLAEVDGQWMARASLPCARAVLYDQNLYMWLFINRKLLVPHEEGWLHETSKGQLEWYFTFAIKRPRPSEKLITNGHTCWVVSGLSSTTPITCTYIKNQNQKHRSLWYHIFPHYVYVAML